MSDLAVEARGVSVRFGKKVVLDGLDLEIPSGEFAVILGRNGAGKTTLLRAALGSLRLGGGEMRVVGIDVAKDPVGLRRVVGHVPDRSDVYPWMTLGDLLAFLAPLYPTWSAAEARRLIATFALPDDVPFRNLSRGQSIKAMIVAALAPMPQVLLLDEPFGGLDAIARDDVVRAVIGELRSGARTVVCVTHELEIAGRLADRVAVMERGKIVSCGATADGVSLRPLFDEALVGAGS